MHAEPLQSASMADKRATEEFHVLIIGAGITGLALAQGLKTLGIRYTIFEKEVKLNYRSNEWTMAIHWALDSLELILPAHIFAKLGVIACNPTIPINEGGDYPIINGDTGKLLAEVPFKRGLRVPRSRMRALCGEGIDVEYGKNLDDVAFNDSGKGVIASFDDGTCFRGSIIIGADGPRSKVREFAMRNKEKAQVSKFPIWHYNITVCYGDAEKAKFVRKQYPTSYLALSEQSFHSFQSISSMPEGPEHPESWIFHCAMGWLGDVDHSLNHAQRLALIKERAKSLGEPARSAFTWIPDDTPVYKADIGYWVTRPWDNREGRITLAGDAAHPMPPYRGQGLNHCLYDISRMLNTLQKARAGESTLKDVITAYDEEVVPRGAEEVSCAVENGFMLHDWKKIQESPVFRDGFRPMTGQGSRDLLSDHATIQEMRDQVERGGIPSTT